MDNFDVEIVVRWSDCDPNRHVRHSAYYDYGAHARINYFSQIGVDSKEMNKLKLGPILFKEECTFIRELTLEDSIRINLLKGAVTPDGSRWSLHHEFFNGKNEKCAHITISGAWLNLSSRKLTVPPADLAATLHSLPLGSDYVHKSKKS